MAAEPSGSTATTSPYHPLFNDPAADTVLRSTEGTLFRVPAFVLRRTTGYFAATLPPPTAADTEPVPLDEPASLLAHTLSILCGLPPPSAAPLDFDTAEAILALSERWAAPGAAARVRDAITGPAFLAEPLRLYVVAVRAGWTDEAHIAARGTLVLSLYDEVHHELLRRLPARDLMALLGLHRRRRDALDRMLRSESTEGVSAAAVSGCCGACGLSADNHLWKEYRARIFAEMDIRALGDTVIGSGTDEWREALACWNAKCAGAGCGKTIYDRDTILPEIKACMDRLPDTV
ncbi:hypothetical protein DFH08DRAFT_770375 [Mycena albidolilacea]|uniref:BTB domain-containing protein n=1 Tax=Mycena albidolilacea TaxID=1033008 RepID=A0AAD7EYS2_9AGAR|nr:hypothetical protein DFH08DRAFT_770375 [Mycena albidolilacea]